jgi:hypothetical protein
MASIKAALSTGPEERMKKRMTWISIQIFEAFDLFNN